MNFDADSFLQSVVTARMDTKVIPCPVGDYPAVVSKIGARQWISRDNTKSGVTLEVYWTIEDASVRESCNRPEVQVRQSIMLDTDSNGNLEEGPGKNIGLGRLREALGMNDASTPFSFQNLPGQFGRVTVVHREVQKEGESDVTVYDEVKSVVKA